MEKEHGFTTRDEWAAYLEAYFAQITKVDQLTSFASINYQSGAEWLSQYKQKSRKLRQMYEESSVHMERHVRYFTRHPEAWTKEVADPLLSYLYRYCMRCEDIETTQMLTDSLSVFYQHEHDDIALMKCSLVWIVNLSYLDILHNKESIYHLLQEAIPLYEASYEQLNEEERSIGMSFYDFESVILGENYSYEPRLSIDDIIALYQRRIARMQTFRKQEDMQLSVNQILPEMEIFWRSTFICMPVRNYDTAFHKNHLQVFYAQCQALQAELASQPFSSTTLKLAIAQVILRYRLQTMDAQTAVKQLLALEEQLPREDSYAWESFDNDALDTYHMMSCALQVFSQQSPAAMQGIQRILQRMIHFYSCFPSSNYMEHVCDISIFEHLIPSMRFLPFDQLMRTLLNFTITRQPQTAVHTVMVSKLAQAMMETILDEKPELLLCLPCFANVEQVQAHHDALMRYAQNAALLHDIGKILCGNVINMQYRRLMAVEFDAIKYHPVSSGEILDQIPALSLYKDVAMGHHKSFDGTFGYPQSFDNVHSPYKLFIDLITICDTLDAATDRLGRNYANEKALPVVLEELEEQKGTRYSDVLVDLIQTSDTLQQKLYTIVEDGRDKSFLEAFAMMKQSVQRAT